eukprot:5002508-Prymnesium_polylepis.1
MAEAKVQVVMEWGAEVVKARGMEVVAVEEIAAVESVEVVWAVVEPGGTRVVDAKVASQVVEDLASVREVEVESGDKEELEKVGMKVEAGVVGNAEVEEVREQVEAMMGVSKVVEER